MLISKLKMTIECGSREVKRKKKQNFESETISSITFSIIILVELLYHTVTIIVFRCLLKRKENEFEEKKAEEETTCVYTIH